MRHTIDWNKISNYEMKQIDAIADRAMPLYERAGITDNKLTATMDIAGTHVVCPIDLAALRDANEETFNHDMLGVRRHFNRRTFELEDSFCPRTALQEA